MLSIGKLGAAGGAEYYLDKVANSVDDYYLGRGEAPGQWVGATVRAARTCRPGRCRGAPEPAGRQVRLGESPRMPGCRRSDVPATT